MGKISVKSDCSGEGTEKNGQMGELSKHRAAMIDSLVGLSVGCFLDWLFGFVEARQERKQTLQFKNAIDGKYIFIENHSAYCSDHDRTVHIKIWTRFVISYWFVLLWFDSFYLTHNFDHCFTDNKTLLPLVD